MPASVYDTLQRPLRELRISVTDRCNFRCTYCMPRDVFGADYPFLPKEDLLTFEEILRVARISVELGVKKIRLTGGEPLLRRGLEDLVAMLVPIPGLRELTLTTNGSLLAEKAAALRKAGLSRVTVSLDSLDPEVFRAMSDTKSPLEQVLEGIEAARSAGFAPVKINAVIRRGMNEGEILPLVRKFAHPEFVVRFIEYMDVGNTNGWRMDEVVSADEIITLLRTEFDLEPVLENYAGEVARRFRIKNGGGEIGIISSVSQPFCSGCTRARLSSAGELFTCLFAAHGTDLRNLLRDSLVDDKDIRQAIQTVWTERTDRYSEMRTLSTAHVSKVEMSHIGG